LVSGCNLPQFSYRIYKENKLKNMRKMENLTVILTLLTASLKLLKSIIKLLKNKKKKKKNRAKRK